MKKSILIWIISVLVASPSFLFGQAKSIDAGVGWGLLQGVNLNASYLYRENLSIGIGIGSHFGMRPFEDEEHFSLTIENKFQFGQNYQCNIRPWVFGQQFVYWRLSSGSVTERLVSFAPTIGVNLAFTNRFVLFVDVGPMVGLVVDVDRPPLSEYNVWPILININARAQLIYRF